jgi:Domain of unknown function (DUF4132)
MDLLNKLKGFYTFTEYEKEFEAIIVALRNEYSLKSDYFYDVNLSGSIILKKEINAFSISKKGDFVVYCVLEIHKFFDKTNSFSSQDEQFQNNYIKIACVKNLLKPELKLDEKNLDFILSSFLRKGEWTWNLNNGFSISIVLAFIEKQYKVQVLPEIITYNLTELKNIINKTKEHYFQKDKIKLLEKIDQILYKNEKGDLETRPILFLGDDPFSAFANPIIEKMPLDMRIHWYVLIEKAQKVSGGKPSKKYLDETLVLVEKIGLNQFKMTINAWFSFLSNQKDVEIVHTYESRGQIQTYTTIEYLNAISIEAIKGIIWTASHLNDSETIRNMSKLVERCYKKIPGKGPAAVSVGNACLYALYKSGFEGISQLSRLKLRVKQSNTQTLIEKYLADAALEQGVSNHEIEDMVVEDFDLVEGEKELIFDDFKCVLKIVGVGKSDLQWLKSDGSPQKSVPTYVKTQYANELKNLKETQKQLDQTTSAQRDRIDRLLRVNRVWSFELFYKYYFSHGLMSHLAKKIIWTFHQKEGSFSAIYHENQWINAENKTFFPLGNAKVSLWHPVIESVADVQKWRQFLIEKQIQQPLKQAFREVYLLTEAELNTRSYSNRMAAHVLKQHQFNMLAKTRGWKYSLLGAYDDGRNNQAASISLPEFGLSAEYWVNELNADGAYNDTGIWNYITTDQVRFNNKLTNELVNLIDVPPIALSEVLRDVDLFVGVASVGNDANWMDTGGLPVYRDYWQSYSFGDLSEMAKNRKEILEKLLPRLKISKIAEIIDKFLVVKGKLRTYKIHIGSTNILMEPNDQYLCIVPDRSAKNHTENIFIPFEGDAGMSIILSKAFLLAEDDKITDSTITSQINRK